MNRRATGLLRFLAAATVLFVLILGLVSGGFASSAHAAVTPAPLDQSAAPEQDPVDEGAGGAQTLPQHFGSCIAGGGSGDIILLMDESGSLKDTDPDNARVSAALHLVNQLADQAGDAEINVQLTAFGHGYGVLKDWTVLDDSSVKDVRASINELADRTGGVDTDYWTAVDSARQELSRVAKDRGSDTASCQSIVFFSDGELDIETRTSAQAEENYGSAKPYADGVDLGTDDGAARAEEFAEEDLCRPGGLADQLRSSKIALFGVGLGGDSEPTTFDLMRSIVTGSSEDGSATCGEKTDPTPGEFYLASDIDSLLMAFDSIAGFGDRPVHQEKGVCVGEACAEEAHRFVLDSSTPTVDVLASARGDGMRAAMITPSGTALDLGAQKDSGSHTVGSITVEFAWESPRTISVSINGRGGNPADWEGLWQFAFVTDDPKNSDTKSSSNVHITPDLSPTWQAAADTELRSGDTVDNVAFSLQDRDGNPVDPTTIAGTIEYTVTSTDSEGNQQTLLQTTDKNTIATPKTWNLEGTAVGTATLELTAAVTTAGTKDPEGKDVAGTKLTPVVVTRAVEILPPVDYPSIPGYVDFGEAEGTVDLSVPLALSGDGCAWIPENGTTIDASPSGFETVQVTSTAASEDSCAEGEVTLDLESESTGNGTINGTFLVATASANGEGEPVEVPVAFTASIVKPLDTLNFVAALVVAIVLGLGIPVGLLYLQKWLTSTIPARPLLAVRAPLTVLDDTVLRDGRPFEFQDGDSRTTVPIAGSGARRIMAAGVELRVRLGASPLGRGSVITTMEHSISGADSSMPARLPLDVHNKWLLLRTPGGPPDQVEILVLLSGTADQVTKDRLVEEINGRGAELARCLLEADPDSAGLARVGATSEGGGTSTPSSPWSTSSDINHDNPWGDV